MPTDDPDQAGTGAPLKDDPGPTLPPKDPAPKPPPPKPADPRPDEDEDEDRDDRITGADDA